MAFISYFDIKAVLSVCSSLMKELEGSSLRTSITVLEQWVDPIKFKSRDYRVNPKGNPSQVVFRHGTELIRGWLLARCVDSPRDSRLAETKLRKMNSMCFDFQKTFQSTDIFCTLSLLFVQLGFPFFVLVWLFILLPFIWFLGSSTNKRQWQRHHYSGCVRVR